MALPPIPIEEPGFRLIDGDDVNTIVAYVRAAAAAAGVNVGPLPKEEPGVRYISPDDFAIVEDALIKIANAKGKATGLPQHGLTRRGGLPSGDHFNALRTLAVAVTASAAVDRTIRLAYPSNIVAATDQFASQQARWGEARRRSVQITARANNAGNVVLGTKTGANNYGIDTSNTGTLLATLAAGQSYTYSATQQVLLMKSDQPAASLPNPLWVDIQTIVNKSDGTADTSPIVRHTLNNVAYYSADPGWLLSDCQTFLRADPTNKNRLQVSTNFTGDPSAMTWTNLNTFADYNTSTLNGFIELANGEIAIVQSSGASSQIWVSMGWSASKATATWTMTLATVGGPVTPSYSAHQWVASPNGEVLISVSGAQTVGGSGNDTTDNTRAVRVYGSFDFGKTWAEVFNIRTFGASQGISYPASVHIHGVAIDPDWNRTYVFYGDNVGDGKTIAGAGNIQAVYFDDLKQTLAASGIVTWNKLPQLDNWATSGTTSNQMTQFISAAFSPDGIIFTPDTTIPTWLVLLPKAGYRQYGSSEILTPLSGGSGLCFLTQSGLGATKNYAVGGTTGTTVAAGSFRPWFSVGPDFFHMQTIEVPYTTTATSQAGILRVQTHANGKAIIAFAGTTSTPFAVGDLTLGG